LNLVREFRHANHYRFRGYFFHCARVAVAPICRQDVRLVPTFMAWHIRAIPWEVQSAVGTVKAEVDPEPDDLGRIR
jgi:hypothetical protein